MQDPFEKNVPGFGLGRDGCRTPMQWDAGAYAGFSRVQPWLPVAADAARVNVASRARRSGLAPQPLPPADRVAPHPAGADRRRLSADCRQSGDSLAYLRESADDRVLVALNFGPNPVTVDLPAIVSGKSVLISTLRGREGAAVDGPIDRCAGTRPWLLWRLSRRRAKARNRDFSAAFALTWTEPTDTYATLYGRR